MGRASSFGVSGFDALDRKLTKLERVPSQRQAVTGVLRRGANVIAREERRLIPEVTGAHRKSITVTTQPGFTLEGASPRNVSIYIGPRRGGAGSTMHLLEWGTSHSAAHPFARPAVDTKGGEAIGIVIAGLGKLVADAIR